MQDHVRAECQMVEVPCPNKGCSKLTQKRNLDKHLQHCSYRILKCQWCKQDIYCDQQQVRKIEDYIRTVLTYFSIQEHENECPYIPVECPNRCLESVPRKEVSIHICM